VKLPTATVYTTYPFMLVLVLVLGLQKTYSDKIADNVTMIFSSVLY